MSAFKKLEEKALNIQDSFKKLGAAVENGKLVEIIYNGEKDLRIFGSGTDTTETQIYDFDNNIRIVREKHLEEGRTQHLIQSGREPIYDTRHFRRDRSNYYVLEGNELVTDEKKVKGMIKEITGVELPALCFLGYDDKEFVVEHKQRFGTLPTVLDEVVTKVTDECKNRKINYPEYQLEDEFMEINTRSVVKELLKNVKGIGFKTCEDFGGKAKLIPGAVEKMFPGLYQEVEKELENERTKYHASFLDTVFGT